MFRVVCFGLKSTEFARFIRYRVANFLVIDLNNVLAFIRFNRQREIFRLFVLITVRRFIYIFFNDILAPCAAGFGLFIVLYVVVVIFNRIPIRAAIIDIERIFGAYQRKRLVWLPLARIIFPIISNRLRRFMRDRRAQLALSDRRRLQHNSRILIDIADRVFSLNILNVYIAVQMPRVFASIRIVCRTTVNANKTEGLVANGSRPFNLFQRNGLIPFMVNATNGTRVNFSRVPLC